MKNILTILSFIIICSCSKQWQYTYHYPQPNTIRIIPVAIDKTFSIKEKVAIEEAINTWNIALNNAIIIKIIDEDFDMEIKKIQYFYQNGGFMILNISSYNSILSAVDKGNTLEIVDAIGTGHEMYIVRDRVGLNRITGVVMHGIGHLLGAHHTNNGLMTPTYDEDQFSCIDYDTIKQIEISNHIKSLNYCVIQ